MISPPLVTAVFGFIVAWRELPFWPGAARATLYGTLVSLTPVALVIFLLKTGRIHDIHMSLSPQQRRLPYFISVICALIAFAFLYHRGDSPLLTALAACNVIGLTALAAINHYWLISNHAASIMMVGTFSAFLFGLASSLWSLPLIGLVAWARWQLQKHTLSQLLAGMAVGAAPVLLLAELGWI